MCQCYCKEPSPMSLQVIIINSLVHWTRLEWSHFLCCCGCLAWRKQASVDISRGNIREQVILQNTNSTKVKVKFRKCLQNYGCKTYIYVRNLFRNLYTGKLLIDTPKTLKKVNINLICTQDLVLYIHLRTAIAYQSPPNSIIEVSPLYLWIIFVIQAQEECERPTGLS